ncbi:MAG TPA: CopG family transcriptional regulator [Chloroflexota bacterium]|jgi:hypothetical protein
MTTVEQRKVNVTISLPADLAREARHLAVDQGTSLSGYLSRLLAEQVVAARGYHAARERQLRLLEKGLPLGTGGKADWSRESLHER